MIRKSIKNRYLITAFIVALLFTAPVFAEDQNGDAHVGTTAMQQQTEAPAADTEKDADNNPENENNVAEEGIDDSKEPASDRQEKGDDTPVEENAVKTKDIRLITVGEGELILDKEGHVICKPAEGYAVTTIIADRDAGKYKAGELISEEIVSKLDFPDGTTVKAVFEAINTDAPDAEAPASATALF